MHGLIFETSVCYWQNQPGCYLYRADSIITISTNYWRNQDKTISCTMLTVDDTSAHRWSLGACRSSLDYNFADEAIYKADCVSLSQETLLQTRFNNWPVVVSHLMLSCLGFSLTWVNSFWYVRLIWIDILLFATRLPSWIITSSFSLWRDVIGKGM